MESAKGCQEGSHTESLAGNVRKSTGIFSQVEMFSRMISIFWMQKYFLFYAGNPKIKSAP
jgi:hypothetical protein